MQTRRQDFCDIATVGRHVPQQGTELFALIVDMKMYSPVCSLLTRI